MKTIKQNKKLVIESQELLTKIEGGSALTVSYEHNDKAKDEVGIESVNSNVQIYGAGQAH
ncbi:hypothetical protein [Pseudoalteromonas rubra]|uniref:hypothetical protein n=1 Tax=Pseudoalteromonas rubra TaxID=43658 RepID=UPI000F7907B2|nr:hypothetical protein [Pseudoalteromonas rubra]